MVALAAVPVAVPVSAAIVEIDIVFVATPKRVINDILEGVLDDWRPIRRL